MKMIKKIISFALIMMFVFSFFSTAAYAADTEKNRLRMS